MSGPIDSPLSALLSLRSRVGVLGVVSLAALTGIALIAGVRYVRR